MEVIMSMFTGTLRGESQQGDDCVFSLYRNLSLQVTDLIAG